MKFKNVAEAKDKVVKFRDHSGISKALVDELLKRGSKFGITTVQSFSVDKLVIKDWVNLKCRYGCTSFGTNWSCPPATPKPDEARKIVSEYTTALLLEGHRKCAEFYRNNRKKREDAVRYWKGIVSTERFLFLTGYYKAFALVSSACSLCKQCTYPDKCRFPQEKRPTIESFSIDLIGTLHNLGATTNVATSSEDTFNYYGLILID
jgi:predicted metal-binding protein